MKPVVYLEKADIAATLTTWIYCAMWQLYAAINTGKTGYIHWPQQKNRSLLPYQDPAKFKEQPNMYDWYFVQPFHANPPPRTEAWLWESPVPEMAEHNLMGLTFEEINRFYLEHLDFNPVVHQRGAALVARYGIDFDKTIGLSWRGTDNVTDGRPRIPIEFYYPFLDEIMEVEPDCRICCTAEEERILDPLLARYPSAFRVEEFFSSPLGHRQNPERFSPFSGFERGMQPALMVWLFSRCRHYIHNRASTAAVADWMSSRKGRMICLGCNPTLDYTVVPIVHPKTGAQMWP